MSTVAVVLAADSGDGFDSPKYLNPVRGSAMLQRVVDDARSWPVDDLIVVLGSEAEDIADAISFGDATVLIDPEWEEGLASPMRAALDMISRDRTVDLVLLARGDQPGIDAGLVTQLISSAAESECDAVVPKFRYAPGWPVVLAPTLWSHFLGLEDSIDIHDVITTHASSIEEVWVDHLAPPILATKDDLDGVA
ncbi:MAG: NTP transferase domain-containing protein [Actinomycetia bacterium]|nr:NTP transferase domain-containing protein [Actinomycetes bacterium]